MKKTGSAGQEVQGGGGTRSWVSDMLSGDVKKAVGCVSL